MARSTLRSAIARIEAEGFTPVALVYLAWGYALAGKMAEGLVLRR